jgi:hypothetical protein
MAQPPLVRVLVHQQVSTSEYCTVRGSVRATVLYFPAAIPSRSSWGAFCLERFSLLGFSTHIISFCY